MKLSKIRDAIDRGEISPEETYGTYVRIGFMVLKITSYEETPGDGLPNIWHLRSDAGRDYTFTPYYGLERA